jgi:hypothetical protein
MTTRSSRSWIALAVTLCWLVCAGESRVRAQDKAQDDAADPLAGLGEGPEADDGDEQAEDDGEAAPGDEPGDDDDNGDESAEPDAPPAREGEPTAELEPAVRTEIAAGMGIGTRSFSRPTSEGVQRLPDAVFPAVDVALRVHAWPRDGFSLGISLRYQSSLGLTIEEQPPFALRNRVDARAERVELSVAPTFRLGDASAAPALAFPIGFTLRSLWPEVHEMMTPGYSLIGPHLRAELVLPLGDVLVLRVGPELQVIIAIDESIRAEGVGRSGVAYGGEALLQLRLGAVFALELTYRESHAFVPSAFVSRADFEDVERFATGRLSGGW